MRNRVAAARHVENQRRQIMQIEVPVTGWGSSVQGNGEEM